MALLRRPMLQDLLGVRLHLPPMSSLLGFECGERLARLLLVGLELRLLARLFGVLAIDLGLPRLHIGLIFGLFLAIAPLDVGGLSAARYLEPVAGLNIALGYGLGLGTDIAPTWQRAA